MTFSYDDYIPKVLYTILRGIHYGIGAGKGFPSSPATRFCAAKIAIFSLASKVAEAKCGKRTKGTRINIGHYLQQTRVTHRS